MTGKTKAIVEARAAQAYKNKAVTVQVSSADPREFAEAVARKLTSPEVSAAGVIEAVQKDTHDINEVVAELGRQVRAVAAGDLTRAEAMLMAQAHTLDAMFAAMVRRATSQEYLKQWEAYMRMGLKAQAQCRATLEALAEIKNPRPVAFVKQANICGGHQQVNNGMQPAQGGGGVESLPAPEKGTARYPTQGIFPPGGEIQTARNAVQVA